MYSMIYKKKSEVFFTLKKTTGKIEKCLINHDLYKVPTRIQNIRSGSIFSEISYSTL